MIYQCIPLVYLTKLYEVRERLVSEESHIVSTSARSRGTATVRRLRTKKVSKSDPKLRPIKFLTQAYTPESYYFGALTTVGYVTSD